jgi:GNAT superfamily N-acetyltransferase
MVDIAALSKSDYEAWLPLWRGYQIFYNVDIPEETTRLTFARLTGGQEPMGAFIARDTSEAVGIVHWIEHRSCWTSGNYCYLQDLFVANTMRSSGIGRKLIEAVYEVARTRKCSRVYWLTHDTNGDAVILYNKVAQKSGFVQYVKRLE